MAANIIINNQPHTPLEATRIADKLLNQNNFTEAGIIYSNIIKTAPTQAEAHIGMGFVLLKLGNWTEALYHATEARKHNPKLLRTYHLALLAMRKNLPTPKSLTWCEHGLKEHPLDPTLLLQKGVIHGELHQVESMLACARTILQHADPTDTNAPGMAVTLVQGLTPARTWEDILAPFASANLHPVCELNLIITRLISLWLNNQSEEFKRVLQHGKKVYANLLAQKTLDYSTAEEGKALTVSIANTGGYMGIFNYFAENTPTVQRTEHPTLYMVGDSHVMPAHRQIVSLNGQTMQIESHLAMGCKLWHLVDNSHFYHTRQMMMEILNALPSKGPILISVGEIDTRANEGIWPLHLKTGNPLFQLIESTIPPAFIWLQQHLQNRHVIVSGIPAPVPNRHAALFSTDTEKTRYAEMIRNINHTLIQQAHQHGWDFLDLHTLTVSPDSPFSNQQWHMENTHLKPAAISEAFSHHLIPAK